MNLPPFDPSAFGFDLSNREIATLIYIALFLAWALSRADLRKALGSVVRNFFAPQLARIWAIMSLYVTGSVYLLARLNAWEWSNLKTTLLWWGTVGFTATFEANRIKDQSDAFSILMKEAISITAVIVFVAELVTFPLPVELTMLPVLTVVGLIAAYAEMKPEHAVIVKPLKTILSVAGLTVLAFSVAEVLRDPTEFMTWDTVREFADPIFLSLLFVPFLFLLAAFMAYETTFTSLGIWWKRPDLVRFARWRSLLAFGIDIDATRRVARDLRGNDVRDRDGVLSTIRAIKILKRRERNPPATDPSLGWSPYEARLFLQEHGIVTDDYHRSQDEWWAHAPSVKLSDRALPDRVSFYITGNDQAVTRMRLALDASYQNEPEEADAAFYARSLTLLEKVFGANSAEALIGRVRKKDRQSFEVDGKRIWVEWSEWGIERRGGYNRNLVILHERHPRDEFEAYR